MVEEEELQFHEEYMNERDPSILHFLLASGDDVINFFLKNSVVIVTSFIGFYVQSFFPICFRSPVNNSVMT